MIGDQFFCAVREFFESGRQLKQINHTIITLVPKNSHCSSVGDYWPIACCNVAYKVIMMIIYSRLKPKLGSLVDQAQSAFVEGRNMIENIRLAQELLRNYNRKRASPRCLIKVYLLKAYDSVDWSFLESILRGLNFPTVFVRWIIE